MNPNELQMQIDSARATTGLVGREEQLAQVDRVVLKDQGVWLIQISGPGGIGKTRLVSEILRRYQDSPNVLAASQPVDLYHTSTHSIEGLMATMCAALDRDDSGFVAYREAQKELDDSRAESSISRRTALQWSVQKTFLADLNRLVTKRRLLLVLDTAEKLVFEITEVERRLGLTEERLNTWAWLRNDFLPAIHNSVVILAGRPQIDHLIEDVRSLKGVNFLALPPLPGFTVDEALAYFEAVAQGADDRGNITVAERIRSLPEEWRRALAKKTAGRPLLLALIIDYLVIAAALPHDLLAMNEASLEKELVRAFMEAGRPTFEALQALAWTRKGMNAELLAHVADRRNRDGTWDLVWAQAALEQVRDLSFVKVRPSDQRVFLHDEMYDLMERHVLQPDEWPAGAERAYRAILAYYQERIQQHRQKMAEAYQSLSQAAEITTISQRIKELEDLLLSAQVEDLHYRLRYQLRADARRGFGIYYYRYAEAATLGGDVSLDAQLRAELLGFLQERDPSGQQEEVDGLPRAAVLADGAIRWVKRRIADDQYESAVNLAATVRKSGLLRVGDALSASELTVWDALARLYGSLASPTEVISDLDPIIAMLKDQPRSWRRDAVLARAYNNLGYALRTEGRYYGAIAVYKKAIPLWRMVKIEVEHANTLNNLAFALSEIGDFGPARRRAEDALEIRQELGAKPQIGLSLNTLTYIAIREGLFITAQNYAEQALDLFETTDDTRGSGLAGLALAEAKRRFGAENPVSTANNVELLQEAVYDAKKACEAFETTGETFRQIEALIELGCDYRDWMKLRRGDGRNREEIERLANEGRKALRQAAELAEERHYLHLQLDAMINEAWLDYYLEVYFRWRVQPPDTNAGKKTGEHNEALLRQVETLIPTHYRISRHGRPPLDRERVVIPVLSRVGKLYLLRGQRAFNEFEEKTRLGDPIGASVDLRQAIGNYTLTSAYDNMLSPAPFRDKRRAEDRIYERMKQLNPIEWQAVFAKVSEMEHDYRLGRSEMRRFLEDNFGQEEDFADFDYNLSNL